jgi:hypothetical protein
MSSFSVREFSDNPGSLGTYYPLVASGLIRLKATTTNDLDRLPSYDIPAGASPLEALLDVRAADDLSRHTDVWYLYGG